MIKKLLIRYEAGLCPPFFWNRLLRCNLLHFVEIASLMLAMTR